MPSIQVDSDIASKLVTIRDYIRWATSRFLEADLFFGHGTDNAWDEAVLLVLRTLHLPWDINEKVLDARLTPEERRLVLTILEARIRERIPAPYLTGEAWFAGLKFKVDERVIVPRSPIAELIERGFSPWLGLLPNRVLDLCCGSGCIGMATALYYPDSTVDLVDLSDDALAVVDSNLDLHKLRGRVTAYQSDLFDQLPSHRYDLIVSNPPYVDAPDLESMPPEFLHEPTLALAAGDDGLDLAKRILARASHFLTDDGWLVMEVGNSGVHLEQQYPQVPWTWIEFEHGGDGVLIISAEELKGIESQFVDFV